MALPIRDKFGQSWEAYGTYTIVYISTKYELSGSIPFLNTSLLPSFHRFLIRCHVLRLLSRTRELPLYFFAYFISQEHYIVHYTRLR